MAQRRAFTAAPNADGDSNAVENDLTAYEQHRLPNGDFLVVGEGDSLDSKLSDNADVGRTPPGWDDADPFDNDDDVAASAADAEAGLALHAFGDYELRYEDVFEAEPFDVGGNGAYSTDGAAVLRDDAEYRETTTDDWGERLTYNAPESYAGPLRITAEYEASTDADEPAYGHVRIVREDADGTRTVVYSEHASSDDGRVQFAETRQVPIDGTPDYRVEIRVVDGSAGGANVSLRLYDTTFSPQFEYDGEEYWLAEVSREPLPTSEVMDRLGP